MFKQCIYWNNYWTQQTDEEAFLWIFLNIFLFIINVLATSFVVVVGPFICSDTLTSVEFLCAANSTGTLTPNTRAINLENAVFT